MHFRNCSYCHHLTSAQLLHRKRERSFLGMKNILLHLFFSNVIVTVHNHNAKLRQTNHSYRKPNQFLLTNFHSQMVLRVITEHVHFNLNPRAFVERAIKPSGGAWPVQVHLGLCQDHKPLFPPHQQPMGQHLHLVPGDARQGSSPSSHSWNEVLPDRSTQNSSALLMGRLPKIHVTKWWACQGGWSAMI